MTPYSISEYFQYNFCLRTCVVLYFFLLYAYIFHSLVSSFITVLLVIRITNTYGNCQLGVPYV